MLHFESKSHLTLGVEIELQLINNQTWDLSPQAIKILDQIPESMQERIKPEIFLSMLEINTDICNNVQDVERDLQECYDILKPICSKLDLNLSTTATHPFAQYNERIVYPSGRYSKLMDRNQWIARRLAIFGVHVHIGMKDGDTCIKFNNFLMNFLPHLLALSSSSPYWQGQDTGLASSRTTIFESSPTAGHPCQIKNWKEFSELHESLIRCKSIKSTKDIWWDIRPSPNFGTIEVRICDGIATNNEVLALVSLIHALVHWYEDNNHEFNNSISPPLWLSRENKWKATRYGMDAYIILDVNGKIIPLREHVLMWLERLEPYINHFKYEPYIKTIKNIIQKGNSSERQRRAFQKNNSLIDVVKHNCIEFNIGDPIWDLIL
jgi:carboxylate-amine ligase